jgi:orotidine-5'-phosphate decarboxylase
LLPFGYHRIMTGTTALNTSSLKERLIIALDVPNQAAAQAMIQTIGDAGVFYKVGLQLFAAEGPSIVRDIVRSGKKVFLDLKFHDIPNTVSGAVRSAAELGATFITVHAAGGSRMLQAAADTANQSSAKPKILAVTMLTSLADEDLPALGMAGNTAENVVRLAKLARAAGCHGLVASPREVSELRRQIGSEMLIIAPGIRPVGEETGDQIRTATPSAALKAGASHLVVGRPITSSSNPQNAAESILAEMAGA